MTDELEILEDIDESEEGEDITEEDEPIELPVEDESDNDEEMEAPAVEDEPPPKVEIEHPKESNVNEKALSSMLDQREKEFREAYESQYGFAPMDDAVFAFRYSEERAIRAEVAAEVERGARQLEAIRANIPQYEQEFQRMGVPKSAATHLVRIAEEYGGTVMAHPKALADAKAMAIGRALLAEGGAKVKKVMPRGESPSSKTTGYTTAERTAMQEMKASGVEITRKSLKEWMAYGA